MPETSPPAEQTTPGLCIYLLGPPRVEWAGQPLTIPRRQARALLFYLATQAQTIPRECLHFLFWPDVPESTARRSLTRLLTHLRRALPAPEILLTTEEGIGLDPRRAWSDVVGFERLCAIQKPHDRASALQQAVQLYRGPFLAGFSLPESPEFEAWSSQERYIRECRYLEALDALMDERAAQGAYDEAIAYAQRYLESDELAEKIHRRLIELYTVIGNRCAALRQFESCVTILERELGVSPLPETQAAYQAALQGKPLIQPPASPTWTTLPSLDAPLVGRNEVLRRLTHACERAKSGEGQVILISGEPGIGKSRLMQDFIFGQGSQVTVVVGSGHEAEQGLPYWPLIEGLRPHMPLVDWTELGIEPLYLAEVARILPELRARLPNLPTPLPVEANQGQGYLFQALAHWFEKWAASRPPLILCLDELHWADETTLAWLGYLSRRIKRAPILVLGAYRTEEAQAVATFRAELARQGVLQEIVLEGLPQPEVLCLIRRLSGQTSGAEQFSQRLQHETNGNPFFLLETFRVLFETGVLWQDEAGWSTHMDETTKDYRELPLPDTVSQAIRDRLGRLSAQAYQVLEAGAVIGHQFDLDLVRMTSGRRESEVVDALDALLARQVISEHDGKYRFNHDLIRAVVYRDLSFGRRRLLHRRAGEALIKMQPDDAAALAWHFEHAEEIGRAAEFALRAGQKANVVYAYAQARAYFDKSLALLEQAATYLRTPEQMAVNQRLRIQALEGRGWVLCLLGDMEAYARDSQELARLAQELGDRRTLAHLRYREANTQRWLCHYAKALEVAEDGIRQSQAVDDRMLEAMCQRELGLTAREMNDYPRAKLALEQALNLFRALRDARYEVHVLGNLSTLYLYEGQHEKAMELAREALARCDEAKLSFTRRLPLGDIGAAAAALGDTDAARRCLLESLEMARKTADRTQEIFCRGHLGWLFVRLEQPVEALEQLQAALALAEAIDSCSEQSWLYAGLAEAHCLAGDIAQAKTHARQALALAQKHRRTRDEKLARQVLATL